jgi:putative membrane protein
MRKERILREAEFSPTVVRYHVLASVVGLAVIVIGIPLIPIVAPVVYWYYTRYYRRLRVVLTARELKVRRGIMMVEEKSIPLEKITDLAVYQGPVMRYMDLKGIKVETAGQTSAGTALVQIVGIVDTDGFRDLVLEQRDRIADGDMAPAAASVTAAPAEALAGTADGAAIGALGAVGAGRAGGAGGADPVLMETVSEIRDLLRRIESALTRPA